MTHHVTAVIVDHGLSDPKPLVVECQVEDWQDATDAVLIEYASMRGGTRNFDLDALEVRCMTMMFRQPAD